MRAKYHLRARTGHHGFSERPATLAKSGKNTGLGVKDKVWFLAKNPARRRMNTPSLPQRRCASSMDKAWISEPRRPQATGMRKQSSWKDPGDSASQSAPKCPMPRTAAPAKGPLWYENPLRGTDHKHALHQARQERAQWIHGAHQWPCDNTGPSGRSTRSEIPPEGSQLPGLAYRC